MANIALFDMDDTLCAYSKTLRRDLEKIMCEREQMPDTLYPANAPDWYWNRINLIRSQPGWWRNLEKLEIGFQILHIARELGFEIHVLTKGPTYHRAAWTEKVEWCDEHLPPDVKKAVVETKELTYGKVLVDDYPTYAFQWLRHRPRGLVIMPYNESNASFNHPNALHYNGSTTSQDIIREALSEIIV